MSSSPPVTKIAIDDLCEASLYTQRTILLEFFRHAVSEAEDTALAQKIYQAAKQLFAANAQTTFDILFCVTRLGHSSQHAGHEARVIYRKLYEHPQTRRMAIVHQNSFINIIISHFADVLNRFSTKKDSLKYFSKRDDALIWLSS